MRKLLLDGINLFNEERYFEAHEVWEDMWRDSAGPLRLYYQGLVQAAVGLHHLKNGNLDGARSVVGRAVEKLEQYPPAFSGIANGEFVSELREILAEMTPRPIRIIRLE